MIKFIQQLATPYSADLNYRTELTKLEFSNTLFSNWDKIRQKGKRTKIASEFICFVRKFCAINF